MTTPNDFAQAVADIFADLAEGQEPLDPEFAKVFADNIENLYES